MTVKRLFPIGRRKITLDERLMRLLEETSDQHLTRMLDAIVLDFLKEADHDCGTNLGDGCSFCVALEEIPLDPPNVTVV